MSPEEKERSRYYQEIAAAFFRQRGGPFMLSPKDMTTIASWETMGVPLEAAREGIEKAMEYFRTQARERGKVRALAACNSQVVKAFERFRERSVGRHAPAKTRVEKRALMVAEIGRFLKDQPGPMSFLREPCERALGLLEAAQPDEEALERLEEKIEHLIAEKCPAEDKDAAKKDFEAEFSSLKGKEAAEIFALKLVKNLRMKYKVPYVTFPYY
jgi:hypothetical protein